MSVAVVLNEADVEDWDCDEVTVVVGADDSDLRGKFH